MDYGSLVNKRVAATPPSGIRRFFDIVSEMRDAISLGVGEPDFDTPWAYSEAAVYSLRQGRTHYTGNAGLVELRRAVAEYMAGRFGVDRSPEGEVLVTVGASEGIDLALRAIVEAGDEVLIPDPSFVAYSPGAIFAGGTPVPIATSAGEGFKLKRGALESAITPRSKALILPFPNNPTGAIMGREDLEDIADALRGTDILVLSDEVYAELTYGGFKHVSFASIPGMGERTIVIGGFSKAFAMTGWRMGYAVGPRELISLMTKIHQYTIMCAPTAGQYAALEALRQNMDGGFSDVAAMVASYDRRRRLALSSLRGMGLKCFEPLGAFYAFPYIGDTGLTSNEFAEGLLREKGVAVVPGDAFGERGEGYVRCSYATSADKIVEAMRRIKEFIGG